MIEGIPAILLGFVVLKYLTDKPADASKNIAMEYARDGIRVNTVAPGIVDTPLHKDNPKDFLKTLSPMNSF